MFSVKTLLSILFLGCCVFLSCDQSNPTTEPSESLVFGTYFNNCYGNCVQLYKIEGDQIYGDQINTKIEDPLNDEFRFQQNPMSTTRIELVKSLLSQLPQTLLADNQTTYGMPDAHDQGGIVIELTKCGKVERWVLDRHTNRLPKSVKAYADQLLKVMDLIVSA